MWRKTPPQFKALAALIIEEATELSVERRALERQAASIISSLAEFARDHIHKTRDFENTAICMMPLVRAIICANSSCTVQEDQHGHRARLLALSRRCLAWRDLVALHMSSGLWSEERSKLVPKLEYELELARQR